MKLSFCIPTFNRAGYIGDTLANLASQATGDVEIVVVDGASTDGTASVVEAQQKRFGNIQYYPQTRNGGVDADLDKAVELAGSEYCWLMSSDDWITPGALQRVLAEIESGHEIYLGNITACTKDLAPVRDVRWLSETTPDRTFDFAKPGEFLDYLNAARSIGALFSYMPAVVVRRRDWLSVKDRQKYFGTWYGHVFTLFSLIKRPCRLRYISSPPLLLTRFGNDAAWELGLVRRLLIDFEGYLAVANRFYPDDGVERRALLRSMRFTHNWRRILSLRAWIQTEREWQEMRKLLKEFGYSPSLIVGCGFFGRAGSLVKAISHVKRKLTPV
jgi:abequosyltransferase